MIPAFKQAKIVHVLDLAATVIGFRLSSCDNTNIYEINWRTSHNLHSILTESTLVPVPHHEGVWGRDGGECSASFQKRQPPLPTG
jgi:hypothetical protein